MKIHLMNGEKGGIGKSFIASVVAQYLMDKNINFYLVATDRSNPTSTNRYKEKDEPYSVKKRYKDFWSDSVRFVIFSESESKEDAPDDLFDLALERDCIVDLPSQAQRPMSKWFTNKDIFEVSKEYDIKFINWLISDGSNDSINLIIDSLKFYAPHIPCLIIRNEGRGKNWENFDENEKLRSAIAEYKARVFDFPKLSDSKELILNTERWTFEEALESPTLRPLQKQDFKNYLKKSYKVIDEILEVLSNEQ